jgi:ABC-2 type transport system ATP-binding protein
MTIQVSNLAHAYQGKIALRGVSFSVAAGEILGYIGPNGAGKSTTIRSLLGLVVADTGDISISGLDVRLDPVEVRRRVGYLPENAALYDGLSAMEHANFVGRLRGLDQGAIERRFSTLLQAFDLASRAEEPVRDLSKGMRQKVAFSLAIFHGPPVLLLDEPLSGLDATATRVVKEIVKEYAAKGGAILYCSHVLEVVERVCDRVVILDSGSIVAEGALESLLARSSDASLDAVFQRAIEQRRDPTEIAHQVVSEVLR